MEGLSNDKEHYAVRNIYCESLWPPKHAASFMSCPHHGWQIMKPYSWVALIAHQWGPSSQHPIKAAQVAGQPQVHIHPQASYKSPWLQLTPLLIQYELTPEDPKIQPAQPRVLCPLPCRATEEEDSLEEPRALWSQTTPCLTRDNTEAECTWVLGARERRLIAAIKEIWLVYSKGIQSYNLIIPNYFFDAYS